MLKDLKIEYKDLGFEIIDGTYHDHKKCMTAYEVETPPISQYRGSMGAYDSDVSWLLFIHKYEKILSKVITLIFLKNYAHCWLNHEEHEGDILTIYCAYQETIKELLFRKWHKVLDIFLFRHHKALVKNTLARDHKEAFEMTMRESIFTEALCILAEQNFDIDYFTRVKKDITPL